MNFFKKYGKIILFDTLATFCFVGVILFGWLPGPGGIPLLLAGLALLAVNHDWAERWLETAKIKGVSFKKTLFPENQIIRHVYDTLSITIACASAYVLIVETNKLKLAVASGLLIMSLFVFLVNRERIDKLADFVKKKK